MAKKGQILNGMSSLVIGVLVVGIVLVVGFLIMAEAKNQIKSIDQVNSTGQNAAGVLSSVAWNATSTTQNAISTIPSWLGIIVICTVGALLIGLVSLFHGA